MVSNLITVLGCVIIMATGPYGLKLDYPGQDTGNYLIQICIGRFIYGLGAGCFTVFTNSFIMEIAPTELRGPLSIAFQFFCCFGILVSYLIGVPLIQSQNYVEADPEDPFK